MFSKCLPTVASTALNESSKKKISASEYKARALLYEIFYRLTQFLLVLIVNIRIVNIHFSHANSSSLTAAQIDALLADQSVHTKRQQLQIL